MTQKEAIIKVLEKLGGKAHLEYIYTGVVKLAEFKDDSDKKATIRATLQRNPYHFRPSRGQKGWWELTSYQEEVALLQKHIAELEVENEQLKTIETADDFVKRLVEETKTMFVVSREKADIVRQVLLKMGRTEEQQELADWIIGKPTPPKIIQNISGSQVFNGNITDSEFNGTDNYGR